MTTGREQQLDRAAHILAQSRITQMVSSRLAPDSRPATIEEAYILQKKVACLLGVEKTGWKVSPYGDGKSVAAPIFAADIFTSGADVGNVTGIETEILLHLKADLPYRPAHPYDRAEICQAIDFYALGFELIQCRFSDEDQTFPERLADCLLNRGLVIGTQQAFVKDGQIPSVLPELYRNDQPCSFRPNPIDPIASLYAYANSGGDQFGGLCAGQWVATGSMTGMEKASAPDNWRATLDGGLDVMVTLVG